MKTLITIVLLLMGPMIFSQGQFQMQPREIFPDGYFKKKLPYMLLMANGGYWYGVSEQASFRPDDLFLINPRLDPQRWDHRISHENKWKKNPDGSLVQPLTPKFPGSTTIFVWTQDGKHLSDKISRWSSAAGMIGLSIPLNGEKLNWKGIVRDGAIGAVSWKAGFHFRWSVLPWIYGKNRR